MYDGAHSLIDFLLVRQSFQQLSGRNLDCPSSAPIGIWRRARITHPYGERYIQTALRQLQHS